MASAATSTLQEPEVIEHSADLEPREEHDAATKAEESTGARPSPEAASKLHRMLSTASTTAAAWVPPALDDSLWAEDDDDEGFSGWTPWTPASFTTAEGKTSDTPSATPSATSPE
ncbi:unnamed protein product [Prorocentrum cordatum]|uniref:Uncharacterized protein n=1 Tax=Prorocentrum cordatum TaxID=2364126 RepID=A0ABN9TPK4_9DINO|nr:unnamed protein product [Polarella glacialis]|mmetsp:Transcript_93591/g.243752  ORF Transcript_93591/g.243752 Transcript_93591/m.243752 type:complete len:115 (+) Transcript_93591:102-446(+)